MITIHRQICTFLLIAALCLLSIGTYANFDPTNPPEPYVTYDVTVGVTPSEAGKATGAGKYLVGDKATIKTTANKNYKFQYWTINGYAYPETATSFTYIVGDSAVVFLAHFKYEEPTPEPWVPTNPPEPYMTQHVSVDLDPLEGGYTRGTGDYVSGTQVKIEAHPYVNYALKYWTINDYDYPETNESFTYLVGDSCVHIVGWVSSCLQNRFNTRLVYVFCSFNSSSSCIFLYSRRCNNSDLCKARSVAFYIS
jgi:hypothetical protein